MSAASWAKFTDKIRNESKQPKKPKQSKPSHSNTPQKQVTNAQSKNAEPTRIDPICMPIIDGTIVSKTRTILHQQQEPAKTITFVLCSKCYYNLEYIHQRVKGMYRTSFRDIVWSITKKETITEDTGSRCCDICNNSSSNSELNSVHISF